MTRHNTRYMMDVMYHHKIYRFLNQSLMKIDAINFGYSKHGHQLYECSVIYFNEYKVFKIVYALSEYKELALSIYISLVRMLYQLNLLDYKLPGDWKIRDKTPSLTKLTQDINIITRRVDYCRTSDISNPSRHIPFWVYNLIYESSSEKILVAPDIYSAEKVIEHMTSSFDIAPKLIPIRNIVNALNDA